MSIRRICLLVIAVVVFINASGCGKMTPEGILIKGAQWAGEQVIKKEFKKHQERKRAQRSATTE